jgi:hypothetical protein
MKENHQVLPSSLVCRFSCVSALSALLSCLALMACREQGTNNTDGSSALVASDVASAADQLSNLVEGQTIKVPAAAIAKTCIGESQCVVQLSDGPEEYIASVVVGLNAETFAALKADLADLQQEQSVLALSGRSAKPRYIYCMPPTLSFPIPDLSRVLKYFTCEMGNYPAMIRESNRINQGSELRDLSTPFPGRLRMNMRRLSCQNRPQLDCRSGRKLMDRGSLLSD